MRNLKRVSWTLAAAATVTLPLVACGTAAGLSCEEIARQATELSKSQPVQIKQIRDLREVSKTETERRCRGMAETSAGTNEAVIVRGYEENGNQMVGYEPEAAGAPAPEPVQ